METDVCRIVRIAFDQNFRDEHKFIFAEVEAIVEKSDKKDQLKLLFPLIIGEISRLRIEMSKAQIKINEERFNKTMEKLDAAASDWTERATESSRKMREDLRGLGIDVDEPS